MLNIEILAFAGCPNVEQTRENVQRALQAERLPASVTHVEVDTPELALSLRFLGSPSVRVNREDVEKVAETRHNFGLMCRKYANGTVDAPGVEMIRAAIRRSASKLNDD